MAIFAFLDKERIVAPPGYTRWLIPPAALCVHRFYQPKPVKSLVEKRFLCDSSDLGECEVLGDVGGCSRSAFGNPHRGGDGRGVRRRGAVPALARGNGVAQWPGVSGVWLQAFDRAGGARHGPIPGAAGSVPVLQWRLLFSIHRNDAHAAARHQAAVEHLAQGVVADPAIGQGAVLDPPGRGAWGEPADGLAHGTCPAPDAGAREPARRHGRDR
jgi:hypothetical protein